MVLLKFSDLCAVLLLLFFKLTFQLYDIALKTKIRVVKISPHPESVFVIGVFSPDNSEAVGQAWPERFNLAYDSKYERDDQASKTSDGDGLHLSVTNTQVLFVSA